MRYRSPATNGKRVTFTRASLAGCSPRAWIANELHFYKTTKLGAVTMSVMNWNPRRAYRARWHVTRQLGVPPAQLPSSAFNRTKRLANAILCLSSWAVTPILLQPNLFARPLGVSENALSGRGKEVAQLVVLNASEPD